MQRLLRDYFNPFKSLCVFVMFYYFFYFIISDILRTGRNSHNQLLLIIFHYCQHRHMLFLRSIHRIRNQFFHGCTAAGQRAAAIFDYPNDISTRLAKIEFFRHNNLSFIRPITGINIPDSTPKPYRIMPALILFYLTRAIITILF